MIYFLVWVLLSAGVAATARRRSLGFFGGFILSLVFSPIGGALFVCQSGAVTRVAK